MTQGRIDAILSWWQHEFRHLDLSSLALVGHILPLARLLEKRRGPVLAGFGLTLWSFEVLATLRW
ncbi:MAG: hypothetical protein AAGE59_14535 [Cyanobacteria bacterium P01_F01_bin.86]